MLLWTTPLFSSNFLLEVFKVPGTAPVAFLSKSSSPAASLLSTLFFYSPLTNFLVLRDGSRASLKWEFALFCCSGEFKDLWDEKNRNQSRLWLLFFILFEFVFWEWWFNCRQLSCGWELFAFKLKMTLTFVAVAQESLVCYTILIVSPSSSLPMGWQDEFPHHLCKQ